MEMNCPNFDRLSGDFEEGDEVSDLERLEGMLFMTVMEKCPDQAAKGEADWEDFKANNEVDEESAENWIMKWFPENCPDADLKLMMGERD